MQLQNLARLRGAGDPGQNLNKQTNKQLKGRQNWLQEKKVILADSRTGLE